MFDGTGDLLARLLPPQIIPPLLQLYLGIDDDPEESGDEDAGDEKAPSPHMSRQGSTDSTGRHSIDGADPKDSRPASPVVGRRNTLPEGGSKRKMSFTESRSHTANAAIEHAGRGKRSSILFPRGKLGALSRPGARSRCIAYSYGMVRVHCCHVTAWADDGRWQVTMLQADIVGFTPLSAKLSAKDVVWMLNDIFFCFDQLTDW